MEIATNLQAREIIRAVLKAKKLVRIYPSDNVLYRAAIDEVFSAFRSYLDTSRDLVYKIRSTEILYEDEAVYQSTEKRDNLALHFFKDGVKEIMFSPGLTKSELEDFLLLLTTDFEKDENGDDFLSAVWERNFENIKLTVDEIMFLESDDVLHGEDAIDAKGADADPVAPDSLVFGFDASGKTGRSGQGRDDMDGRAETKGDDEGADLLQRVEEDTRLKRAYADGLSEPDIVVVQQEELSPEEMQMLLAEMRQDSSARTEKMIAILFSMLSDSSGEEDAAAVGKSINELIRHSLNVGDFRAVATCMRELKVFPDNGGPASRQAATLFASLSSREVIDQVGRILDSTREVDEAALYEFSSHLGKEALIPFVDLLNRLNTISARRQVNNILIQLGRESVQHLIVRLSDHLWYVVRNIVYVLRHIGDPSALEPLIRLARHEHPRVRLEVLRAINDYRSVRGLEPLRAMISDPDATVRLTAVMVLGQLARETHGALEFARDSLMSAIGEKSFDDREFREKKTVHEMLASLSSPRIVEQMMAVLRKKSLFRSRQLSERKAAAAYLLGLAGAKEALPLLNELRAVSDPLVREHVLFALNRLEHG